MRSYGRNPRSERLSVFHTRRIERRLALVALITAATVAAAPQDPVADTTPLWGGQIDLVEEARIGTLDGPVEESFGSELDVAMAPDGSIYVVDVQSIRFAHFSADGEWLGDIGREGQGPGEFIRPFRVEAPAEGEVWLYDVMGGRVTRFRDGEYEAQFISETGLLSTEEFQVDRHGRVWIKDTAIRSDGTPDFEAMAWRVFTSDGELLANVPVPPAEIVGPAYRLTGAGLGRPFSVETLHALSPAGAVVSARNDTYRITVAPLEGTPRVIERHLPQIRPTRAERAWWRDQVERAERATGRELSDVPAVKPLLRYLSVDAEARIWVSVYAEAEEVELHSGGRAWRQPATYEVLDERGWLLGRLTFPDLAYPVAARGRTVWARKPGQFGESYLIKYRIQGVN